MYRRTTRFKMKSFQTHSFLFFIMMVMLIQEWKAIEQDQTVRAAMLKSDLKSIFCAGIDFKEFMKGPQRYFLTRQKVRHMTASYSRTVKVLTLFFLWPLICNIQNLALASTGGLFVRCSM